MAGCCDLLPWLSWYSNWRFLKPIKTNKHTQQPQRKPPKNNNHQTTIQPQKTTQNQPEPWVKRLFTLGQTKRAHKTIFIQSMKIKSEEKSWIINLSRFQLIKTHTPEITALLISHAYYTSKKRWIHVINSCLNAVSKIIYLKILTPYIRFQFRNKLQFSVHPFPQISFHTWAAVFKFQGF